MRSLVHRPLYRISAIFIKEKHDEKYQKLTYMAKGLSLDDENLMAVVAEKVAREFTGMDVEREGIG